MCWTVPGDDDFRQNLDDLCMGLNELASAGAAIEVTFYDMFPILMSQLDFSYDATDIEYLNCTVTFRYKNFTIKKL